MEVVPSIVANSSEELKEIVAKLEPYVQVAHLDIMDGIFVANRTIGFEEFSQLETNLKFRLHLMVSDPESQIEPWLSLRNIDTVLIHAEAGSDLEQIFERIKVAGKKTGLVFNPETWPGDYSKFLPVIDVVQFMTVHPGQYGAEFLPEVIDKIQKFHQASPNVVIAADGGVNPETAKLLKDAGASVLVAGSYIIKSEDVERAINDLNI